MKRYAFLGPGLLLISRFATQVIVPIIALLIIRYLDPDQFGIYASALAITTLLMVVCDFGIQQAVLQHAAQKKDPLGLVLQRFFLLSLGYAVLAFGILGLWFMLGNYSHQTASLAFLLGINFLRIPILSVITAGLQIRSEYLRIGSWNLGVSLGYALTTLIAIATQTNLLVLVALPNILSFSITLMALIIEGHRLRLFTTQIIPTSLSLRHIIVASTQFGSSSAMHRLYHNSDAAILSALRAPIEVGFYTAAFRLIEFINTIPSVVFNQVLQAKYFLWSHTREERLHGYYLMTTKLMFSIGVVVAIVLSLFSREIVLLIFGKQHSDTALFLAIMAWAIPARFWASSPGAILLTDGRVGDKMKLQAYIVTLNITLNLVTIPLFGGLAAAVMMVVTDSCLAIFYTIAVQRLFNFRIAGQLIYLGVAGLLAILFLTINNLIGSLDFVIKCWLGLGFIFATTFLTLYSLDDVSKKELRLLMSRGT
jgi:O-antigen/teichoic acid export membrane protein